MLTSQPVFLEQKLYFKVLRYLRDLYGDVFRVRDEFYNRQRILVARFRTQESILLFTADKLFTRPTERRISELELDRTYLLYCLPCNQFASAPFRAYFHEVNGEQHQLEEIGHVNRRGFPKRKRIFKPRPQQPSLARRIRTHKKTFPAFIIPYATAKHSPISKVPTQTILAAATITIDGITINPEERRVLLQRAGLLEEITKEVE